MKGVLDGWIDGGDEMDGRVDGRRLGMDELKYGVKRCWDGWMGGFEWMCRRSMGWMESMLEDRWIDAGVCGSE